MEAALYEKPREQTFREDAWQQGSPRGIRGRGEGRRSGGSRIRVRVQRVWGGGKQEGRGETRAQVLIPAPGG